VRVKNLTTPLPDSACCAARCVCAASTGGFGHCLHASGCDSIQVSSRCPSPCGMERMLPYGSSKVADMEALEGVGAYTHTPVQRQQTLNWCCVGQSWCCVGS